MLPKEKMQCTGLHYPLAEKFKCMVWLFEAHLKVENIVLEVRVRDEEITTVNLMLISQKDMTHILTLHA